MSHPALTAVLPVLLAAFLGACGVADTGSTAVTAAKLKAKEADQLRAMKQDVDQQLEAARQQAEKLRKEAEAANR